MRSFFDFYFRSAKTFWILNFAIITLIFLGICMLLKTMSVFFLLMFFIAFFEPFLIWTLGGYKKIKADYYRHHPQKANKRSSQKEMKIPHYPPDHSERKAA